jgi:anti-sigma factor RsiW
MPFEELTLQADVRGELPARRRSEMEAVLAAQAGHGA